MEKSLPMEEDEPVPTPPTLGFNMADFLGKLEDYNPPIPDAVTIHYLQKAGLNVKDPRLVRLISVASLKYVSDIANDALQHCKMRSSNNAHNTKGKGTKDRRFCLTLEDLTPALAECEIVVRKPQYYV